jgi:hypothetical protein
MRLRKQLERSKENGDDAQALQALRALQERAITIEVLKVPSPPCCYVVPDQPGRQKTKIGVAVNRFKTHENEEIASAAGRLVSSWKKVAQSQRAGHPAFPPKRAGDPNGSSSCETSRSHAPPPQPQPQSYTQAQPQSNPQSQTPSTPKPNTRAFISFKEFKELIVKQGLKRPHPPKILCA